MSDETDGIPDEVVRPTMRERLNGPGGRLFVRVGGIFVILTLILLAFGLWWPGASLPTTASDTQIAVRNTIIVFSIAAAPVMALVWAIAYYSLRHWTHSGETPPEDGPPIRGNGPITLTWIIVSSLLTAFLLIWGLAALTRLPSLSK
jgi:heme/copper-type cytochrome/quinol oxidase subunit 2